MADGRPEVPPVEGTETRFDRFFRRPPRQGRSRALVGAVVEAFQGLLQEGHDVDAKSIAELVKRAGVGPGSFYEYFFDRDSLMGVLIGTLTKRNFDQLLAAVDAVEAPTLPRLVEAASRAVAGAYLAQPRVTRAVALGVVRLGLHGVIMRERDRFAAELSIRAAPHLPAMTGAEVERAMRLVCDASMGIILGEIERTRQPDVEAVAASLERAATAFLVPGSGARPAAPPASS